MKILLVSSKYQPEYSGSGLRAHNTYKRLNKKYDVEFDVIANSINHLGNKSYEYDHKIVYRISSPIKIPVKKSIKRYFIIIFNLFWEVFYSWKFIRRNINRYDLLHTFGNTWTIGFLTWYFSKKNKPIIRELCNEMPNPLYPIQFKDTIKKIFQKDNTLVVAISRRLEILAKKFEMKNIWTRPNPIDETKFFIDYGNKYFLRKKLTKFNEDDIVLSFVANYIDRKNQLFALEVLNLLPKQYKLVLAGPLKDEGREYFEKVKDKIKKFKLENRVDIYTGFVNNFDEYLKCSDVFLFPSKAEGLGTPLLESQVCAIPVVSNYIKGISDMVIENGKGGYYLEINAEKWADTIKKTLEIPKEVLVDNAKHIYDISSSSMIDEEYYKRIKELIND